MTVIMYTKDTCPQCRQNKMFFNAKKIKYVERNIDQNEGYKLEAEATGLPAVPIIVPDIESGLSPWYGFKPEKLIKLL